MSERFCGLPTQTKMLKMPPSPSSCRDWPQLREMLALRQTATLQNTFAMEHQTIRGTKPIVENFRLDITTHKTKVFE